MKPQTIGRTLGIGFRVAGRLAAQRIAGPPAAASGRVAMAGNTPGSPQASASPARTAAIGQAAGRAGRGVAGGVAGFLRPFRRLGGIVCLEVAGVFFMLPVLVFGPRLWQTRASWDHGPNHRTFVASAVIIVVFFYLSISSFWRAHKRSAAK